MSGRRHPEPPAADPAGCAQVFRALARTRLVLARAVAGAAHAGDGSRWGREADHVWSRMPVPIAAMNRVMLPRLEGPPHAVEARVDAICARFGGGPFSWWLDPGARPAALLQLLQRMEPEAAVTSVPAMAFRLEGHADGSTPPLEVPLPPGVAVELVRTTRALVAAESLAAEGFGAPPGLATAIASLFAATDPGAAAVVAVVASLDGRPASTGLACLAGEVAGIYNVATLPAMRRRGLGAAVMAALLEEARRRGARLAVLESSEDGRMLYEHLGFRWAGDYRVMVVDDADGVTG